MIKLFFLAIASLALTYQSFGQQKFIQIETNKTLCVFSFLETSSRQLGTSNSFREYILQSYKQDKKFNKLVNSYSKLNLNYSIERKEFPEKRRSHTKTKDLLWIAASNSKNINDFSQRIIGFLPHETHVKLIELLKDGETYYNQLIWDNEQKNIYKIQNQLDIYTDQISDLYLKISKFYNTSWDTSIPFKVMLYPIPLKKGSTTAIPKGNALICGFLSHNEEDYKVRLGVIIHEMCHILYKEQTSSFQYQIDKWFNDSNSKFASLAYTFFNESLATVLGNGWAHKQIHKELDTNQWYNNEHIDGFAHSLYPLTKQYLDEGKSLDQNFINMSIKLFEERFPKAINETDILMNSLQLFANTENQTEINKIANNIHNYFNIRSMWLSTPILSSESIETFDKKETTKLFIIGSDNSKTIKKLNKHYTQLKINTPLNTINMFKEENSMSNIIIINIDSLSKLNNAFDTLSSINHIYTKINYKITSNK